MDNQPDKYYKLIDDVPFDINKAWRKFRYLSFKKKTSKHFKVVISCILVNKYTGDFVLSKRNSPWIKNENVKTIHSKKHKYIFHCEHFAIYDIIKQGLNPKDYYFLITFEPCPSCFASLFVKYGVKIDDVFIFTKKKHNSSYIKRNDFVFKMIKPQNERDENCIKKVRKILNSI